MGLLHLLYVELRGNGQLASNKLRFKDGYKNLLIFTITFLHIEEVNYLCTAKCVYRAENRGICAKYC